MLTVYYNETQYQKLTWCLVFIELINYLVDKYNANVVHHKGTGGNDGSLYIKELNYNQPDCVLMIHNSDNDGWTGITWEDNPGEVVNVFIRRNNPQDKLQVMQFSNKWGRNFDKSTYNFQILQGTHYPFYSKTNHDYYYQERKFRKTVLKENFIDQMFFLGRDDRPVIWELRKMGYCNENYTPPEGNLGYMESMIKYKMGAAISGIGELCCREIEYLAVGVPMIKLEYITQLNPPLIPNFHYVAIDRDKNNLVWDCHMDIKGSPQIVEAFKERFLEVKDDQDFLDFIAKNGREYYEAYSHPCNRLKHLTNILGL